VKRNLVLINVQNTENVLTESVFVSKAFLVLTVLRKHVKKDVTIMEFVIMENVIVMMVGQVNFVN